MKLKKVCIWFLLGILTSIAWADEDNLTLTPNPTSDLDVEESDNSDPTFSSSAFETLPEPIGLPKPNPKPHHHHKQKSHLENVSSNRSPVYEVVNQPCNSYGCRGFGQETGYQPWPSRGNRFVPYPQPGYGSRRRGPYSQPEYYPDGYYGPREPDYGYGPRGRPMYPQSQGRYGDYGEYNQPSFGSRFLG